MFKLISKNKPAGDQPQAIKRLISGLEKNIKKQTLLGVTGSGKTFTAANVIATINKPTLVIAPNKTLAAQLCNEFRELFPENAVHYFVSYYDYYQPEAYIPTSDTYIGKEAMINDEIDRLRHAATASLLTRSDVIVVASVSCIYGLGAPEAYEAEMVHLRTQKHESTKARKHEIKGGKEGYDRAGLMKKLIVMHFTRTTADLKRGTFRLRGDHWEIMPADQEIIYSFELKQGSPSTSSGTKDRYALSESKGYIEKIFIVDPVKGFSHRREVKEVYIFPAKHFVTPPETRLEAIRAIKAELAERLKYFEKNGKLLEAERLERRTRYDMAMMKEIGYCHGVENYSRHLSGRPAGSPPDTLLSYFPKDFLLFIDESHITVPQISGMYEGDQSRKKTLIEFGFRLPSAADNRPLGFREFEERAGQTIYMSATPGRFELENSGQVVEQIIRPTGLIDPEVIVRPITGSVSMSDQKNTKTRKHENIQNPHLNSYPQEAGGKEILSQIDDVIERIKERTAKGERALVTTLTKKMAEDLTRYLQDLKIKVNYIHSDVDTLDRIKILSDFRRGVYDVIVGVNLLREGLDLPEVTLVAVLDADKEGFLRSETSLIQTIGRAARNINGQVVLYADVVTGSIERAMGETARRRKIQLEYNKKHNITPKTIQKNITDIIEEFGVKREREVKKILDLEMSGVDKSLKSGKQLEEIIKEKQKQMKEAAERLDFELAAILRDEVKLLKLKK